MDLMNINSPCVKLTLVADTSGNVAIGKNYNYISIYNPDDAEIYVKTGPSDQVVAAATDTWIPPKTAISFRRDPAHTHLAAYSAAGTPTVLIQNGSGQ